jgi:hypothetical protein
MLVNGYASYCFEFTYRSDNGVGLASASLKHTHNHTTMSAAAYGKNPVSEETKERLKSLFTDGHSPVSALEQLKLDLAAIGADLKIMADRSVVPSYHFCNKLVFVLVSTGLCLLPNY